MIRKIRTGRTPVTVLGTFAMCLAFAGCDTEADDDMKMEDKFAAERAALRPLAFKDPPDNPTNRVQKDPAAAALGHKWFFDPRYCTKLGDIHAQPDVGSLGNPGDEAKLACVHCHDMTRAGEDTRSRPRGKSLGVRRYTLRHSQNMINTVFTPLWTGWDGRRDSIWAANMRPPERGGEGRGTRLQFVHILQEHYTNEYNAVFGAIHGPMPDFSDLTRFPAKGKPGDPEFDGMADADKILVNRVWSNFGKAIEAYLYTTLSKNSPFDKWLAGDDSAMSPSEIRGAKLFAGKANCIACHTGPNGSDYEFHNTGVSVIADKEEPNDAAEVPELDRGRERGKEVLTEKTNQFFRNGMYSDDPTQDAHLGANIEPDPADLGKFRTPGLRSVSLSAPFMQKGSINTMEEVIEFYNRGGDSDMASSPLDPSGFTGVKDPLMKPLNLTPDEKADLVNFMNALTGEPLPTSLSSAPVIPGLQ